MKKILILLLLICSISVKATTFQISDQAAFNAFNWSGLVAGDRVQFNRGVSYYGGITLTEDGTAGNPIIFEAYGTGANPVITGFASVTAWTNMGSNIWESTSAVSGLSNCNMVLINGVNTEMGRYPNSSAANEGYLTFQTHSGKTSITSSSLTGTPDWTGAEVVIRTGHFIIDRSTITSQSGGTLNFNTLSQGYEPSNLNGFFIQNDSRTLDVQNEWYYNPTTKKIRIYSTSQPTNVKVASVEKLIEVRGNYLRFENIDFTGANGAAMYNWDANPRWNNITIKNCNFSYMGVAAINVLINYLTIDGCSINQINGGAISSSYGSHVYIKNNTIQNVGVLKGMRTATYFGTNSTVEASTVSGFVFEYNNVINSGYNGVSFYGDSIRVRYNYIDNFCNTLDDGGGIYTFTGARTAMTDVVISNNICVNGLAAAAGSKTPDIASGIYLDEQSANVEVAYNTTAFTEFSGLFLNSALNINIHNNTIYDASLYSMRFNAWAPVTGLVVNNNICVAKELSQKILYTTNGSSDFPSRYTGNNNIFASLIGNTSLFQGEGTYSGTLSGWKTYISPDDSNSTGSPKTIPDDSEVEIRYNETASPKQVYFSWAGIDMNGTQYASNPTLQPYTSLVLIKNIPNPTGTKLPAGKNGVMYKTLEGLPIGVE